MKNRSSSAKYNPRKDIQDSHFSIRNTTKGRLPRLSFKRMKEAALGKNYNLSLAFVGETRARSLNRIYRQKNTVPNILSFPLESKAGEIVITPRRVLGEAKHFNMSPRNFMGYLFIHGLLHLKGYKHGDVMEREERKILKQFHLA